MTTVREWIQIVSSRMKSWQDADRIECGLCYRVLSASNAFEAFEFEGKNRIWLVVYAKVDETLKFSDKMSDQKVIETDFMGTKNFVITSDKDIVNVREFARNLAEKMGFTNNDRTLIASAVSEICRNVIEYAVEGEVRVKQVSNSERKGIEFEVEDKGPGIADIKKAMQDGYSTSHRMGVGLPGTKRIMDDFQIESEQGRGTKVVMCKWQ